MNLRAAWLRAQGLPPEVDGVMSTRAGGTSGGAWAGLNLGNAVGDDAQAVAQNRRGFAQAIGARPVFLEQVHGTRVVRLDADVRGTDGADVALRADASLTTVPGVACSVLVADCLPVLFAAPSGRGVAAAHAGWRGLAGGVLEATLAALCAAAQCTPAQVSAWLGACIGPRRFEVGADVLQALGAAPGSTRFVERAGIGGKWLADLPGLARDRLHAAGVHRVAGGDWCTVEDGSRFYSFRRDGVTGRMAAAVWIRPR